MEYNGLKIDLVALAGVITAVAALVFQLKGNRQRKKNKEEKSNEEQSN